MYKILAILIILSVFHGCSNSSIKKVNENTRDLIKSNLRVEELKFIHSFTDSKGDILGKLYGKSINDTIYSDFLIINEINNKSTLVYSIEKATFQNANGKENLPINSDQLYGYMTLILTKDGMDIETLFKIDGIIFKSDPISILWNAKEQLFKVLITP
jgi:hypothetical protein